MTKETHDYCIGISTDVIGKPWTELETPALMVDLDIMEANMDKMMRFLEESGAGVGIRPHAKSHKTPRSPRCRWRRSSRHLLRQTWRGRGDG